MKKILNFTSSRRQLILLGTTLLYGGCASLQQKSKREQYNFVYYRVQEGETLYDLCRRSGLSKEEIMGYNNLDSENLVAGQLLKLPDLEEYPDEPRTGHNPYTPPVEEEPPPVRPELSTKPRPEVDDVQTNLKFVSRGQWGAEPIKWNHNPMNGINKITIHHTSEYPGMDTLNDLQIVRKIAQFHREVRRWADIGYHYLIGRDGRIYEGRPVSIQGAHVRSGNENNLGISLIGDFSHRSPNALQIRTISVFLAQQQRRYGIPNSRVYGHRDLNPTECPGEAPYQWLSQYRLQRH